jgi:hypothetical protein
LAAISRPNLITQQRAACDSAKIESADHLAGTGI